MSKIFQNKEYLEASEFSKRVGANIADTAVFLALVLILVSSDNISILVRILIVAAYIFLVIPISLSLGASPGQLLMQLRIRQANDYSKRITLFTAYLRIFLVIANYFIGLFTFKKRTNIYDKYSKSMVVKLKTDLKDETLNELHKKTNIFRFGIASTLYILFIIWLGNYWYLIGLPIIFDIYITKKVNWTFWKKREGKNSTVVEWLDALIFAVIAVTLINIFLFQNYKIPTGSMEKSLLIGDHLYVSKVAYGPRVPQTPLSFPFAQHTMPLTKKTKSYVEWIKLDYKRLKGLSKIKRDDVVVFNFPAGDTVVVEMQAQDYYGIARGYAEQFKQADIQSGNPIKKDDEYYAKGRQYVWDNYDIVVRPVDRRDNYIKRCVAIAGDSLEVRDRKIFVNGKPQKEIEGIQYKYWIKTSQPFNPKTLEKLNISSNDMKGSSSSDYYLLLTSEKVEKIKEFSNVVGIQPIEKPKGAYANYIFPHDPRYPWNEDNFGPLYIPKKGATVDINIDNLSLYKRIIDQYEDNDLEVVGDKIFINGEETTTYTFKMDYYFMMGDNRHDSADSRFWGFVPEDHVVGKPKFVWLSLDQDKSFPKNIRLKRMFIGIK